ncbi:MAG: hypothetical protein QW390_05215, partial [Candidatus Bathyarchaeia archaeon]
MDPGLAESKGQEAAIMEGYRCVVCDSEMSPSPLEAECSYCGKREKTDYICPRGHYVCEECRLSDAEKLVRKTCKHIKDGDPLRIAKLLMRHPAVSMHGPE